MQPHAYITDTFPFALADAVLTPALRGAGRLALAAARALHRAYCVRDETRVASVLGIPAPGDIRAVWVPPRRSLREALVIGSKLADLAAIHPAPRLRGARCANGQIRLAGREGGLKRYFATTLPDLPYPTAMRYRRLALRLLRVLGTPAALPLEWMLSQTPADTLTDDASLAAALREGRRKLADILSGVRSQRDLARHLDRRPDSGRLPLSRNSALTEREAAVCGEILRRNQEKLAAAVASGRSLSSAERHAWSLLKRLRKAGTPYGGKRPPPRTGVAPPCRGKKRR